MKRIIMILFTLLISYPIQTFSGTLGDVNGDGKIDLTEAIHALQVVVGTRKPSTVYSNSSLSGAWLLLIAQYPEYQDFYLTSTGDGAFSDIGAFGFNKETSTYSVNEDGSLAITLYQNDGPYTATGELTSPTSGTLTFSHVPAMPVNLVKVSDPSVLEGSWTGTLREDAVPNTSYPVTLSVNSKGEIISMTGFLSPVSGKLYCENGRVVGFIRTSENSSNPNNQIHINATLVNSTTISGTYGNEGSGPLFDGTLTFTKM